MTWTVDGPFISTRLDDVQARVVVINAQPLGIDWFATLADTANQDEIGKVLRATFEGPLTPTDLAEIWSAGQAIGGVPVA